MADLDDLDRRLLAALRVNARDSIASLARSLEVTRATVMARLDRMEASGTILGYTVRVREDRDPDLLRAIAFIELEGRTTDAVIRKLRGVSQVAALHSTNGGWDLVAELRTRDLGEFDKVLGIIRSIEGVINSETSLLLSSVLRH